MPVSASLSIPGADAPARTTEAARLQRIRARAKASTAVVDLLASLAFGDDPEAGWAGALPPGMILTPSAASRLEVSHG